MTVIIPNRNTNIKLKSCLIVFTEGTHKKMLSQIGSQDMTELQDISNEAIAENLKMRLKAGVIYVC